MTQEEICKICIFQRQNRIFLPQLPASFLPFCTPSEEQDLLRQHEGKYFVAIKKFMHGIYVTTEIGATDLDKAGDQHLEKDRKQETWDH